MRTYSDLKLAMKRKGYVFFEQGDYNLNIIFERTSDTFTNKFDDWMYIAYKINGRETVNIIPATSKPGLYGHGTATDPIPGGVAVTIPNQYRSAYQWIPKDKGWGAYPFNGEFFTLHGTISVWRDNNKDNKIDHVGIQGADYRTGVNIHKMSNPGSHGFPVNNWSNGCSGAEEPSFMSIVPIVNQAIIESGSDIFTATWLETKDFS